MWYITTFGAVVWLSLTCVSVHAGAQYKTRYQSIGGGPVDALVDIDGADGTYTLSDGTIGTLSNLKLQNIGGQQILRGNWSLNGTEGTVAWKMGAGFDSIDGTWRSGGMSGTWKGKYDDGEGTIGDMGPRKLPRRP